MQRNPASLVLPKKKSHMTWGDVDTSSLRRPSLFFSVFTPSLPTGIEMRMVEIIARVGITPWPVSTNTAASVRQALDLLDPQLQDFEACVSLARTVRKRQLFSCWPFVLWLAVVVAPRPPDERFSLPTPSGRTQRVCEDDVAGSWLRALFFLRF